VLCEALAGGDDATVTDESQDVERLGHRPRLVSGSPANLKVTWPDDLALAAAILAAQESEDT
jgi:2-C-methyl-D-erythritol 4-phosphate cytidylyltransferase